MSEAEGFPKSCGIPAPLALISWHLDICVLCPAPYFWASEAFTPPQSLPLMLLLGSKQRDPWQKAWTGQRSRGTWEPSWRPQIQGTPSSLRQHQMVAPIPVDPLFAGSPEGSALQTL